MIDGNSTIDITLELWKSQGGEHYHESYVSNSLSLPGRYIFEILFLIFVLMIDLSFIILVLSNKHIRSEKLCWIPLISVVFMCISSIGYFLLKLMSHNSFEFLSEFVGYCVGLRVILEFCHYIIPIFMIENSVIRMMHKHFGSKKFHWGRVIFASITVVFLLVIIWQSSITYFLGYRVQILSLMEDSQYECMYLSPKIIRASAIYDICSLILLMLVTILQSAFFKHNCAINFLTLCASFLKILWPIEYFQRESIHATHLNYWFFYANVLSNGFLPLIWLFLDKKHETPKEKMYSMCSGVEYNQECTYLINPRNDED